MIVEHDATLIHWITNFDSLAWLRATGLQDAIQSPEMVRLEREVKLRSQNLWFSALVIQYSKVFRKN